MRGRRSKYGGAKMQWQSIVLPTATAEALKAAAFQADVSFSELVRGLLADGIKYQAEVGRKVIGSTLEVATETLRLVSIQE